MTIHTIIKVHLCSITISWLEAKFTDQLHDWNKECKRLSAACLCSSQQIAVKVTMVAVMFSIYQWWHSKNMRMTCIVYMSAEILH